MARSIFEMTDEEIQAEMVKAQKLHGILLGIAFLAFIVFVGVIAVIL